MGCELIGITEDGRSVRFDFERVTKVSDTTTEVMMYPDVGVALSVRTSTVKPAPSERSDTVEILQAILMIPAMVAFDPKDGQGVKQYLRREDVVSAVIEAGRR